MNQVSLYLETKSFFEKIMIFFLPDLYRKMFMFFTWLYQAEGVPEERSDEQRWVSYCPLNQTVMPQYFEGLKWNVLKEHEIIE